ncbi:MAG: IS110 family transposase [Methanotrichaceae archaeon]|nr:IS110 family transposase [Methanotrichaceae archaeon]
METQKNKVCGADIHKKFLIATILSRDGTKIVERFGMTIDDLLRFKNWVMENQCEQVAVESTGTYWIPIHTVLEDTIDLIVANAYKIKHTPGRKTDISDSEWLAELCLNGMIEPSRIFPKADRELRRLTRAREGYVNDMTREKNRIHHSLESCGIKLSSVLADIFGKSGRYLMNSLMDGVGIEEILEGIPVKRIRKKADQIKESIRGSLDTTQIILIRGSLEQIESIQKRIAELDKEIKIRVASRKEELNIATSIPGIGFTAAAIILAEIGDFKDFDKPEQLASWAGLVPAVYQSADKLVTGRITKHGSRHIRRILVEVAQVIARTNRSKLKRFFLRVQAKKGHNVAAVALARKVLCILHHLLTNREMYQDENIKTKKTKSVEIESSPVQAEMRLEEMIRSLVKAGYEVRNRKPSPGG